VCEEDDPGTAPAKTSGSRKRTKNPDGKGAGKVGYRKRKCPCPGTQVGPTENKKSPNWKGGKAHPRKKQGDVERGIRGENLRRLEREKGFQGGKPSGRDSSVKKQQ